MAYALALAALLRASPPPEPPPPRPWRLVDQAGLHVGVRGHVLVSPGEVGGAVTVQVTASWLTW
jgi:hypothetical protein